MTKLRSNQTLWALGMRGWVELRACKVPPKAYTTTLPTLIQATCTNMDNGPEQAPNGRWRWPTKVMPKTITLKTTTWDGGRVIGALTTRRFMGITKLAAPRVGVSIQLTQAVTDKLLKELETAGG